MVNKRNPNIAILASGGGTTAEAFVHATQNGIVAADVKLVICNKPPEKAGIHEKIDNLNKQYGLGIKVVQISGLTHPGGNIGRGQTQEEAAAICELLDQMEIDHVAAMGYMRIIGKGLIDAYGWRPEYTSVYQARMSNTHPGPTPHTNDTYGIHTSQKVLDLGLPQSQHTFHLIAEQVDEGPVLARHDVKVMPGDTAQTLFDRVQQVEKEMLPLAIGDFLREQREYLSNQ